MKINSETAKHSQVDDSRPSLDLVNLLSRTLQQEQKVERVTREALSTIDSGHNLSKSIQ